MSLEWVFKLFGLSRFTRFPGLPGARLAALAGFAPLFGLTRWSGFLSLTRRVSDRFYVFVIATTRLPAAIASVVG